MLAERVAVRQLEEEGGDVDDARGRQVGQGVGRVQHERRLAGGDDAEEPLDQGNKQQVRRSDETHVEHQGRRQADAAAGDGERHAQKPACHEGRGNDDGAAPALDARERHARQHREPDERHTAEGAAREHEGGAPAAHARAQKHQAQDEQGEHGQGDGPLAQEGGPALGRHGDGEGEGGPRHRGHVAGQRAHGRHDGEQALAHDRRGRHEQRQRRARLGTSHRSSLRRAVGARPSLASAASGASRRESSLAGALGADPCPQYSPASHPFRHPQKVKPGILLASSQVRADCDFGLPGWRPPRALGLE